MSSSEHQRFKGKENEQHLMHLNGQNFVYVRDHMFGQGIHLAIVFTYSTTNELKYRRKSHLQYDFQKPRLSPFIEQMNCLSL